MSIHADRHQSILRLLPGMLPAYLVSTLFSVTVLAQASFVQAADSTLPVILPAPATYEAEYEARAMGMSTEAYRRLEKTADNQFILSHGLKLSVLGANMITVEEKSLFSWDQDGAMPLAYHYSQTGVRRRDERVTFNWTPTDQTQASADMNRDGRLQKQPINKATLDNLSFSAQLSADLMNKPALRIADTILTYEILDARRMEKHEYRVLGEERINTPSGELDTIKLERIRDIESERTTMIWLSKAHHYTLAKLSQTEGGGSAMELSLTQITWTDESTVGNTAAN